MQLLRSCWSWMRRARKRNNATNPLCFGRYRPRLEWLESRLAPATRTWTGLGANDLWSNSANWDTGVPQNDDDVLIPATVASASVLFDSTAVNTRLNSLDSDEPFEISTRTLDLSGAGPFTFDAGLTLSSGVLTGTSTVSVSGTTTWTNGDMEGSGETITNGPLAITASAQDLDTRTLTVNGGATLDGTSNLDALNGATLTNNSLFDITTDADIRWTGIGAVPTFDNTASGTLRKSGATGETLISFRLDSVSPVEIQTGTLNLDGGGSSTSSFDVPAGTTLRFDSGYALQATSAVIGAGTVRFSAGTVQINGSYDANTTTTIDGGTASFNVDATTTTLTLSSSGVLTGAGTLTVSGTTTWTFGHMLGSGATITNGPLAITASNQTLDSRTLTVNGGATLDGSGSLVGAGGAVLTNNSLFDITTDAAIRWTGIGAVSAFDNTASGTLRKSGGTGETLISFRLDSVSPVEIQTGTLNLDGGGSSTSSFDVPAGTTLRFDSGYTLQATSAVIGAGTVRFSGSTVQLNGGYDPATTTTIDGGTASFNVAVSTTTLNLSNGNLTGAGTLTVSGTTTWTNGHMQGMGETITNGPLAVTANSQDLDTRTLTLNGGATLDGNGNLDAYNGATLTNIAFSISPPTPT